MYVWPHVYLNAFYSVCLDAQFMYNIYNKQIRSITFSRNIHKRWQFSLSSMHVLVVLVIVIRGAFM